MQLSTSSVSTSGSRCPSLILLVAFVALLFAQSSLSVPTMDIGRCPTPVPSPSSEQWFSQSSTKNDPFQLYSGKGYPDSASIVYSCFNDSHVSFKIVTQGGSPNSTFTECNDPLYKYETSNLRDLDFALIELPALGVLTPSSLP